MNMFTDDAKILKEVRGKRDCEIMQSPGQDSAVVGQIVNEI